MKGRNCFRDFMRDYIEMKFNQIAANKYPSTPEWKPVDTISCSIIYQLVRELSKK